MNLLNLWNRLKGHPRSLEEDLDEELAFHQSMKERDLEQTGISTQDARAAALRSLGNVTAAREEAREAWSFRWLTDLAADFRYGARTLFARPGFALAATLALTLGLGVNGLLFTVFNALSQASWTLRDPSTLAMVYSQRHRGNWSGVSWPEFRFLNSHSQSMAGMAAWDGTTVRLTYGENSWNVRGIAASDGFFPVLGTGFATGRAFLKSSDGPVSEVVLQYDFWQNRLGGDIGIVGQWIRINGHPFRIAGATPKGFSGPAIKRPDVWFPAEWMDAFHPGTHVTTEAGACCAEVIGRLKPGVDRSAAQAEFEGLSRQFRNEVRRDASRVMLAAPTILANPELRKKATPVLAVVAVATLLILLLACANVASLLLARGAARMREFAIRRSLGAGRLRLVRQLLAENLVLSLIAAGLTLLLSHSLPDLIAAWAQAGQDRIALRFTPDWRVAAFVLAASLVTTFLAAFVPAAIAVRRSSARGSNGGQVESGGRWKLAFLTAQLSLCVALLSCSSLLFRAMQEARNIEPAFRYSDVIVLSTGFRGTEITEEQAHVPIAGLRERLAHRPGITGVAHSTIVPLGAFYSDTYLSAGKKEIAVGMSHVSAGYFDVLAVPVLRGRSFDIQDEGRKDIVIVNQSLASELWPGEIALGKILPFVGKGLQVVGIVQDFGSRTLVAGNESHMYFPSKGRPESTILVRYTGKAPVLRELPQLAAQVDRRFLAAATPFSDLVEQAKAAVGIASSVSNAFAAIGLGLAFVGLYAVAAYHVTQRTREIGLRMALGAQPRQVLGLVLRHSGRAVVIGSMTGLAGSFGLAKLLGSLLYGVAGTDWRALAITLSVLIATVLAALWYPAIRAIKIDPACALRED